MRTIIWIALTTFYHVSGYRCVLKQYTSTGTTARIMSSSESPSNYDDTSSTVKSIVGGLTSIVNSIWGDKSNFSKRVYSQSTITPSDVLDGVVGDFERGYLFSGAIDAEIYDEQCSFTDPTISFEGLSTFERNIASLKPVLDRFVGNSLVVLYSCKLTNSDVVTRWRMSGDIKLPWNPRIELTGSTRLTFDQSKSGRIVKYFETWDVPASIALFQLLQPSTPINFDIEDDIAAHVSKTGLSTAVNIGKVKAVLLSESSLDSSSGFNEGDRSKAFLNAVKLLEISSSVALTDNIHGAEDVATRVMTVLLGKLWHIQSEKEGLSRETNVINRIVFTKVKPEASTADEGTDVVIEGVVSRSEASKKGYQDPYSAYDPCDQRSINLLVCVLNDSNIDVDKQHTGTHTQELLRIVYLDDDILVGYRYQYDNNQKPALLVLFSQ